MDEGVKQETVKGRWSAATEEGVTDKRRLDLASDDGCPLAHTQIPETTAHGGDEGGRSQSGVEAGQDRKQMRPRQ